MSHDDDWLKQLLRQWTTLSLDVREQLHLSMQLALGDRKNQCRLEQKRKLARG